MPHGPSYRASPRLYWRGAFFRFVERARPCGPTGRIGVMLLAMRRVGVDLPRIRERTPGRAHLGSRTHPFVQQCSTGPGGERCTGTPLRARFSRDAH
jgi:hypothetical protein